MKRLFLHPLLAMILLGATNASPQSFVSGEVMLRFAAGSLGSCAVEKALQDNPPDLRSLEPAVAAMQAGTRLPLKPDRLSQVQQQASPDIVTLMVTPQDSISLNYFVYSGAMLSMSLRNPNDVSRFAAESATLTSMLSQYNISLPSKLPYASQPRIDVLTPPLLPNDIVTVQRQQ